MADTLAVRDVPSKLHERLQRHAEAHRRSLSREVVALLEETVDETSEDDRQASGERASIIERIDRLRESGPAIHDRPAELKRKRREGLA
jgi:plasmid stability protein